MFKKITLAAAVAGVMAMSAPAMAHEADSSVTALRDQSVHPAPQGFSTAFQRDDGSWVGAAASYMAVEEGSVVRVICVEYGVQFVEGVNYHADGSDSLDAISADDLSAVRWLAGHMTYKADGTLGSSPVGTPILAGEDGITAELLPLAEGSAAQLAVWKHTQGVDISGTVNPRILTRANELADILANPANRAAEGAHDFYISSTASVSNEGVALIEAMVSGQYIAEQLPMAGVPVTITAEGIDLDVVAEGVQSEITLTSDESGKVSLPGISGVSEETVITASGAFALLPGTVLSHETGQQVATLDVAVVDRSAVSTVTVEPAPTTTVPETTVTETTVPETTVPETTVPETTVPETTVPVTIVPEDEPLPQTGGGVTIALLGLGAVAGFVGFRMRRGANA